jgi:hypothetical protein
VLQRKKTVTEMAKLADNIQQETGEKLTNPTMQLQLLLQVILL